MTHAVDQNLDAYLRRKKIGDNWVVNERVAVCISSNLASQQLIARGARMAEGMDAEFYVLHVDLPDDADEEKRRNLAANLRFAENLSARIIHLQGSRISVRWRTLSANIALLRSSSGGRLCMGGVNIFTTWRSSDCCAKRRT